MDVRVSDLAALRIRERGPVVLAAVTGEIDVTNATRMSGELAAAVPNTARGLLLDLSELDFMDSSGVHMLYTLAEQLSHRQQRFAVVIPRDRAPRRAIELSGTAPAGWLREDQASGLASLGT